MSEALFDHATHSIEVGSKSFATASKLFDPDTRRSAVMLYAWCRHCDDVIDGQESGFGASRGDRAGGERRLAELFEQTHRAYGGEQMSDPAFAALQAVTEAHGIPKRFPLEHLEGFAMDVREREYVTVDDTLEYCYHVAGVVGVMMAMVMGAREPATLDRACDLGLAFQLTNIARDIVEDAEVGRCYLPLQWLEEEKVTRTELAHPRHRDALARLAARLVNTAEPYYASAEIGLSALPFRSAWAVATARNVYREIGVKVKALGSRAWDERVSTSKLEKLRLLASGAGTALSSRGSGAVARPSQLWQRPR
jgi:phytoene synthase